MAEDESEDESADELNHGEASRKADPNDPEPTPESKEPESEEPESEEPESEEPKTKAPKSKAPKSERRGVEPTRPQRWLRRAAVPIAIYVVTALTYVLVAGPRTEGPSPDNHFAHLARSFLEGELHVLEGRPPGTNDWACFDTAPPRGACMPNALQVNRPTYRWYVSFPPLPAIILMPLVAMYDLDFSDPLFWALFAGLAPMCLFFVLRRLREEEISRRSLGEDLALVTVFAFGSVYFSTAVQGSVWFSAHVVASVFLCLFFLFAIGAKRPFWAGAMLALCFLTRPSTSPFALFFLFEAMRASRPNHAKDGVELIAWLRGVRAVPTLKACVLFSIPILAAGDFAMWMNEARFDDPYEFGHRYLMIYWRPRIETWGLFNYHYFGKNLAIVATAVPWLSATYPHIKIGGHGLALWVTSPNLVPLLWPKKVTALMVSLFVTTAIVVILDLFYQNSGWLQFGYRFSLDYMPALIILLALSGRRFGWGFYVVLGLAIVINAFGAVTFLRGGPLYDQSGPNIVFQPD